MLAMAEWDLRRNLIYIFEQEKTTKTYIIPQITYNRTQICTSHMLAHILRQKVHMHRHKQAQKKCRSTRTDTQTHALTQTHAHTYTESGVTATARHYGKGGWQGKALMYVNVHYLPLYTECVHLRVRQLNLV